MTLHIGGVTTEEHIERSPEGLMPPAVTITAYEEKFFGWKNSTLKYRGNYESHCAGANSSADFVSCARERTFSLEEAVPAAYKGFYLDYPETENLTGDNGWSWDLTNTLQGR